jgi:DNA polymerase-3 subunit chi
MLAGDESQARELDDLLWTFNDDSFVPHAVCRSGESVDPSTPVYIGTDAGVSIRPDLVLNLAGGAPDSLQRFARIAEIIDADEERKRLGRDRFKTYRDAKVTLETHQLDE